MTTMHEVYGDGSILHEACPICGLCSTCGDCLGSRIKAARASENEEEDGATS